MLVSNANGSVFGCQVSESSSGTLDDCARLQLNSTLIHRTQWYPNENAMFCVTQPGGLTLIDAAQFTKLDSYRFTTGAITSSNRKTTSSAVYWSDWNAQNPNLIAVGLSNSSVRFVDLRVGSAVQQLHVQSTDREQTHHVARVLWAPHDTDCLLVGDTSGYLHVFDIRRSRQSICLAECNTAESICAMQHTPDRHRILIGQGLVGRASLWTFKRKRLRNVNVNFSAGEGANLKVVHTKSSFLKCQMHCTDNVLIRPVAGSYGEVKVQSLETGATLNTFVSPEWETNADGHNSTSVAALYDDFSVVYSGSRQTLRVWSPSVRTDQRQELLERVHADNWSDNE